MNRLRPRWFFQTSDTLNVTFPVYIFEGIKQVSDSVFGDSSDWSQKLVAFGSDGAAVMTGKDNGVVAKLKQWKGSSGGIL